MNKTKKIISIVLALVLVASIGTIMLVSNAGDNNPTTSVTVTVDKTELKAGESATVTVKATTNYAVGTMSIPVFYDKTLVTVSDGTVALAEYETKNVTTDLTAVDMSKIYDNTNIDSEKFGFVLASYIAGANSTVQTMLEDDVVLAFKITAKVDVSGTAAVKVITESAKTTDNIAGMLYFGKQPDGNTIDAIPENIEGINVDNAGVSVKIGGGKPELLLSAHGEEIGAVISRDWCSSYDMDADGNAFAGCVMGIDTLGVYTMDAIIDCLETPAGSITVNTDATGGVETTGAVIELRDENDEIVERYVFIYFGDVDCDGAIMGGDGTAIMDYEATYEGFEYEYLQLAADVDGDGAIMGGDGVILIDYEGSYDPEASYYPSQAELAQLYA